MLKGGTIPLLRLERRRVSAPRGRAPPPRALARPPGEPGEVLLEVEPRLREPSHLPPASRARSSPQIQPRPENADGSTLSGPIRSIRSAKSAQAS